MDKHSSTRIKSTRQTSLTNRSASNRNTRTSKRGRKPKAKVRYSPRTVSSSSTSTATSERLRRRSITTSQNPSQNNTISPKTNHSRRETRNMGRSTELVTLREPYDQYSIVDLKRECISRNLQIIKSGSQKNATRDGYIETLREADMLALYEKRAIGNNYNTSYQHNPASNSQSSTSPNSFTSSHSMKAPVRPKRPASLANRQYASASISQHSQANRHLPSTASTSIKSKQDMKQLSSQTHVSNNKPVQRVSRGCRFRLINVLFGPVFIHRWNEIDFSGVNKSRTGVNQNKKLMNAEVDPIWQDIQAEYMKNCEQYNSIQFEDPLFTNTNPDRIAAHNASKLQQVWIETVSLYNQAMISIKQNMNPSADTYSPRGFYKHCAGRLDVLYLHLGLLLKPDLINFIFQDDDGKKSAVVSRQGRSPARNRSWEANPHIKEKQKSPSQNSSVQSRKRKNSQSGPTTDNLLPEWLKNEQIQKGQDPDRIVMPLEASRQMKKSNEPKNAIPKTTQESNAATKRDASNAKKRRVSSESGSSLTHKTACDLSDFYKLPAREHAQLPVITSHNNPESKAPYKHIVSLENNSISIVNQHFVPVNSGNTTAYLSDTGLNSNDFSLNYDAETLMDDDDDDDDDASCDYDGQQPNHNITSNSMVSIAFDQDQQHALEANPNHVNNGPNSDTKAFNDTDKELLSDSISIKPTSTSTEIVTVLSQDLLSQRRTKRVTPTALTTTSRGMHELVPAPDPWDIVEKRLRKINECIELCQNTLEPSGNAEFPSDSRRREIESDLQFYTAVKNRLQEQLLMSMTDSF